MILNLQNIYKDYQQDKLVVPVLKMFVLPWKRESMLRSWDRPVPERQHL